MEEKKNKNYKSEKQFGKKMNEKPDKKKRNIIIGCCVAALVTLVVVVLFFVLGKDEDIEKTTQESNKDVLAGWDNSVVDLQNELVSKDDELYKSKDDSSERQYAIFVNKSQNCIIIYKKDAEGTYTKPYKSMICSVGFDTPIG